MACRAQSDVQSNARAGLAHNPAAHHPHPPGPAQRAARRIMRPFPAHRESRSAGARQASRQLPTTPRTLLTTQPPQPTPRGKPAPA